MDENATAAGWRPRGAAGGSKVAYLFPWKLTQPGPNRFRLVNAAPSAARRVTVSSLGRGTLVAPVMAVVGAWASVPLALLGSDLAIDTVLVVRWVHPETDDEYLWRATF